MNWRTKTATGVVALALVVGCVTAGWARDPARAKRATSPAPTVQLPSMPMPYTGYGDVLILDDATLFLNVRERPNEDDLALGEPGELLHRVAYELDTEKLSLIEHDGMVFLDRNGAELLRRGVSGDEALTIEFGSLDRGVAQAESYILERFSGDLKLRVEERTGAFLISVTDDETGRQFSVTLRPPHDVPVRTREHAFDVGRSAATMAADDPGDDGVRDLANSECKIACTNGSGSISCTKKGCKCVCDNGEASCSCTNKVEN